MNTYCELCGSVEHENDTVDVCKVLDAQAQEIKTLREERNYIDEKATQDYARHLCEIDNLKAELQRARELCIVRAAEREEVDNGIAAKDRIISEQAEKISQARVGIELALTKKPGMTFPDAEVETLMRRAFEMLGGK